MATKTEQSALEIKEIILETVTLRIVGETPLIMHAWSEKAKREILDKQMKATKTSAKKAKNPVEDFIRSMYWLTPMPTDMTEDGFNEAIANGARFGFPVTASEEMRLIKVATLSLLRHLPRKFNRRLWQKDRGRCSMDIA